MLFHRQDRRLLAVLPGPGATRLVPRGRSCIPPISGGGLDYFLETVFNYPTLAECYKVAALDASAMRIRTASTAASNFVINS